MTRKFAPFEPRFDECRDCRFYRVAAVATRCKQCGAGEFFEEKDESGQPSDTELMDMLRNMDCDDE